MRTIGSRSSKNVLIIIFWIFTKLQCRYELLQVEQNVIPSIGNFVYELPHELPNDLRLVILGNQEILGKTQTSGNSKHVVPFLSRNKTLPVAVKKCSKTYIKVSQSCSILLSFFTLFQISCPGFSITELQDLQNQHFISKLTSSSSLFILLLMFSVEFRETLQCNFIYHR